MMKEVELQVLVNEKLCDLADAILYFYNPCHLDKKNHTCKFSNNLNEKLCCGYHHYTGSDRCVFLKEDGCSYRNIKCKTKFCLGVLKDMDSKCFEAFKLLESISNLFGLARYPSLEQIKNRTK